LHFKSLVRARSPLSFILAGFLLLPGYGPWLSAAPVIDAESAQAVLKQFSPERQRLLLAAVLEPGFDGVIPVSLLKQLLQAGEDEDTADNMTKLMTDLLPLASHYSLPPVSSFRVGAVGQGSSGAFYLGANLEIAAGALAFAVHAEQSAVNNALLHGEKGLKRIAVTAAPCGHCRQFLNELHLARELEIIVIGRSPMMLSSLLPQSFGPADLGIQHGLFSNNGFPLQYKLHQGNDTATCLGKQAARYSYAPHSNSASSVVLKLEDDIFVGVYIENAAFNPSLPPLQSALDRVRFKNTDFSRIEEALLFEMQDAGISQKNYTKAVLNEINPAIVFKRVLVK